VVILLGLAAHAEEMAEAAAREPVRSSESAEAYRGLVDRYEKVRAEAMARRPAAGPAGVLALLGPEPAGAVDVMENLPEGETLFRVFATPEGWVAFRISADAFEVSRVPDDEGLRSLVEGLPGPFYLAYEDPAVF